MAPGRVQTGAVTQPGARARADEIAQRWIRTGTATGEADWPGFSTAVKQCYRYAGLPEPGAVVPVPSPLVGALAAPIAAALISGRHEAGPEELRDAVRRAMTSDDPRPAGSGSLRDTVHQAVSAATASAGPRLRGAARRAEARGLVEQIERVRPRDTIGRDLAAGTYDAVERALRHRIHEKVVGAVERSVAAVVQPGFPAARAFVGGQWDVARCAWRELADDAGNDRDTALAGALSEVGWWWPQPRFVIVSDRPRELHLDGGRLHRADGPALRWADGFELYFLSGVHVDRDVILHPDRISVTDICAEPDIERRRIMIDRLGADLFVDRTGAEERHSDGRGVLWRIPRSPGSGRALQFLQVIRPTPDRSPGSYWLKTSPGASTAREAAHRSVELMIADAANPS